MRFALTAEQRDFRDAVDALLKDADCLGAARALDAGDLESGRRIRTGLAEIGLTGLAVPEEFGGSGVLPVEMCVALERIGYHAAPGTYPDSLGASVVLADTRPENAAELFRMLLEEDALGWLSVEPDDSGQDEAVTAYAGFACALPPVRTVPVSIRITPETLRGVHIATLLTAARLLGLGRAALDLAVAYARQRVQYGRPIGEYQAVKHQLANALVALEFARPLVFGAALDPLSVPDVSAAKAAASDAAYQAARTALQVHGAIGYTAEYDLSVYFEEIRRGRAAWGTPAFHRARLLAALD